MIFKYDLLIRPATPLAASPPFAPAQIIQLLDRGGEAKQVVQLLVSEETGGGHFHLQTIGEVPQGADAVLHDLNRKSPTLHSVHHLNSFYFSFHFNPIVVDDSSSQQEQTTIMRSYSANKTVITAAMATVCTHQ